MFIILVAGIGLFTAGRNLEHSLKSDFAGYVKNSGYDITVVLKDTLNGNLPYLDSLPIIKDVSYVNRTIARFKSPVKQYEENTALKTFSEDYNLNPVFVIKGILDKTCVECIYFSQQYSSDFPELSPGDPIELKFQNGKTKEFKFGGVIKDVGYRGFYRFGLPSNGYYKEIAIKTKPGTNASEAVAAIDDAFLAHNIDVLQVVDSETRLTMLDNHLKPTYGTIQAMGICTMILALIGMLIVLDLSIHERAREMGIMKAVGGSVQSIVRLLRYEHLISTSLALVTGIVFGFILNSLICALFGVMVIEVPVLPLNDYPSILGVILALFLIQIVMIDQYGRYKIRKTSASLLNQVF